MSDAPKRCPRLPRAFLPALGLSLVPAVAVAARGLWRTSSGELRLSLFDDAMISMSYARTFAEGHGLVWYPGAPRVEGFTNLSWTLLMALLHRVGLGSNAIAAAIMALGVACVWLAAVVVLRLARQFGLDPADRRATFFTAAVVTLNFPLLYWAVRGMEVGLVTLLMLLATLAAWKLHDARSTRASIALAVVVALGVITRTDFVVVAAGIGLWVATNREARRWRVVAPLAVGSSAALVVTTAFRLWYYDRPFPNTYYLKLEGVPLSDRLGRGLTVDLVNAGAWLLPSVVLIALGWRSLGGRQRRFAALLGSLAAVHVAYSTYAGGDAWEHFVFPNRYLTPGVVCLSVLAVLVIFATADAPASSIPADRREGALLLVAAGPLLTALVSRLTSLRATGHPAWLVLPAVAVLLLGGAGWARARRGGADRPATMYGRASLLCILLLGTMVFRAPKLLEGDGNVYSQLGERITHVSSPDATVAVTGAGGVQYFSRRAAVDLFGKNDRVVAEAPPSWEVFLPGHDKWNLEHSLGDLRPDLLLHPAVPGLEPGYLDELGYVKVQPVASSGGWLPGDRPDAVGYALGGSEHVRWDLLARTPET